ncbi:hypothetical protein IQ223_13500 [Microcystis aeruginosa LEGE 00239]|jgi:hypothetical protein|uniref:hypothetical protein n=1 Tax=Microcystis aeruginosa TaxID=1126 RepID=UPI000261BF03|nr:hypothetical protein [Microcystis aeruginosa]MBE9245495.1 hypothetical protein [Microcystis aeruginosa LEGE 00239]CCI06260.1 hypothetical protein MICAD_1630009 [Microcystis aeruginosa PCC 7941]
MEAELQILEEFIKTNPDSRELKRALGVKLALSGYAYPHNSRNYWSDPRIHC